MHTKRHIRSFAALLCIVLIAAAVLCVSGCSANNTTVSTTTAAAAGTEATSIGEGSTTFPFTIIDADGNETAFLVSTNETIVGTALLALELIEGEEGPYGLYVKTVNGITVDYDKDGKYWAFYENGEYGMNGVDMTEIKPDTVYTFKVE